MENYSSSNFRLLTTRLLRALGSHNGIVKTKASRPQEDQEHSYLYAACPNLNKDDYICRLAKTPSEVQELTEAGFEYVCVKEDLFFFLKRK